MAVSRSFPDKQAAVAGIGAVREYAGMGHITDLCPEIPATGPATGAVASGTRQNARTSSPDRSGAELQRTLAPAGPAPRGPVTPGRTGARDLDKAA